MSGVQGRPQQCPEGPAETIEREQHMTAYEARDLAAALLAAADYLERDQ